MGRFIRILKDNKNNLYSAQMYNLGQLSNCYKEETDLVYDYETKIIYYKFIESLGRKKVAYFAPYINKNGKYCRFNVNFDRIEEIG